MFRYLELCVDHFQDALVRGWVPPWVQLLFLEVLHEVCSRKFDPVLIWLLHTQTAINPGELFNSRCACENR